MEEDDVRPVWERSDLVQRALRWGRLTPKVEENALQDLRAGSLKVLSSSARTIYDSVKKVCQFPEEEEWERQFPLLEHLVNHFYRGGPSFGCFEVLKERRKATARPKPETGTTVTQPVSKPKYLGPERQLRSSVVDIGGVLKVPGHLLRFTYRDGEPRVGTMFTETRVQRVLRSGVPKVWSEWWYSLARRDNDDALLRDGVIPGQQKYVSNDGIVRTTPIVSLSRYTPGRFGPGTIIEGLCIELHPKTGQLIDIRGMASELGGAMVTSPHHHEALLKTLLKTPKKPI